MEHFRKILIGCLVALVIVGLFMLGKYMGQKAAEPEKPEAPVYDHTHYNTTDPVKGAGDDMPGGN